MIISNAIPKAGGHLLYAYLGSCGLEKEPGELYADVDVKIRRGHTEVARRPVGGSTKKIWNGLAIRSPEAMLADIGRTAVVNGHVHDGVDLTGHAVAFMYRNPRNILYSAARFSAAKFNWNPPVTEPDRNDIVALIRPHFIRQAVERARCSFGWMQKADVVVSFEDFLSNPVAMAEKISCALDIETGDPQSVIGDSTPWVTPRYRGTWSGQPSDWRKIWTPEIDAEWRNAGGHEVESMYGYAN